MLICLLGEEMINIDDIVRKFEPHILENIDSNNMKKIIVFLARKDCDFIDEVINNYMDIFLIDYNTFVNKYDLLELQYGDDIQSIIEEMIDNS